MPFKAGFRIGNLESRVRQGLAHRVCRHPHGCRRRGIRCRWLIRSCGEWIHTRAQPWRNRLRWQSARHVGFPSVFDYTITPIPIAPIPIMSIGNVHLSSPSQPNLDLYGGLSLGIVCTSFSFDGNAPGLFDSASNRAIPVWVCRSALSMRSRRARWASPNSAPTTSPGCTAACGSSSELSRRYGLQNQRASATVRLRTAQWSVTCNGERCSGR